MADVKHNHRAEQKCGGDCPVFQLSRKDDDFGFPHPGRVMDLPIKAVRISGPKFVIREGSITLEGDGDGVDMDAPSVDAEFVLALLPSIVLQFLEKNEKYKSVESGYDLGDKGIIPDLNRKLGILVDRIWHGHAEVGEGTDEVIDDLIGHLLLMRAKRARQADQ